MLLQVVGPALGESLSTGMLNVLELYALATISRGQRSR